MSKDREAGSPGLRETPGEVECAMASAVEFLENEATAIGLHDVGYLLRVVRARLRDGRKNAMGAGRPHR